LFFFEVFLDEVLRAIRPFWKRAPKIIRHFRIRVARFFLVQNTKTGKNIPNYHELYQMSIKYNNISGARPSIIYPNLDFWFEKKPSGKPVSN
jgi:hypothetical protein